MSEQKRECGNCSMCCKVLGVVALDKDCGEWCRHIDHDGEHGSCSIYHDRPEECRTFNCLWLQGFFADGDRPDKIGVVFYGADGLLNDVDRKTSYSLVVAGESFEGAARQGRARVLVDRLAAVFPMAIMCCRVHRLVRLTNNGKLLELSRAESPEGGGVAFTVGDLPSSITQGPTL